MIEQQTAAHALAPAGEASRNYETADEVIAYAGERGWKVSRDQLKRWHRAGVLPRPQQVGLGRGAGSETRYLLGTSRQLVAACELQRRYRSLPQVAWELCFAGYDVRADVIRDFVTSLARWHDRVVRLMRAFGFARALVPDCALKLIQRLARRRLRVHGISGVRRRLGNTERLETVLRAIAQVTTGAYEENFQVGVHDEPRDDGGVIPGTDSDGLLVERAAGLGRARVDRLAGAGPWLKDDPTKALAELGRFLGGMWLPEVERASDHDLREVREQSRELQLLFVSFGDVVREHFGPDAFGFPAIADALRAPTPLQGVAFAVLLLRARHDDELRAGIAQLREVARTWRTDVELKLEALRMLRREVPTFGALLAPRRIGDAMRSEAGLAAFQAELQAVALANRERVNEALASLGLSVAAS